MMHLPCAVCGRLCSIPTLHAWVLDRPLCSRECARDTPVFRTPTKEEVGTEVGGAIGATLATLNRLIEGERRLFDTIRAADASNRTTAWVAGTLGGPLLKVAVSELAHDGSGERAFYEQEDIVFELDGLLRRVMTASMAAHALEAPVATKLLPIFTVDLPEPGNEDRVVAAIALRHALLDLAQTVDVWASSR